mgnify:CR=1 FL=1
MSKPVTAIMFLANENDRTREAYSSHKPTHICFICRQEAVRLATKLIEEHGIERGHYLVLTIPNQHPIPIARVFYQAYFWAAERTEAGAPIRFLADVKPSQDLQILTTLASFFGLDIRGVAEPLPESGDEYIGEILGLGILRYVVDEFNVHRYDSAARMIQQTLSKTNTLRLRSLLRALEFLAEGYRDWQNFQYLTAKKSLQASLNLLSEIERDTKAVKPFRESIATNAQFLERVLGETRGISNISPCLLVDLFLNGLRSLETRDCVDSVVRLYRCAEGCMKFRVSSLESRASRAKKRTRRKKELDLIQSYRLLVKREDSWVRKLEYNEIKDIMFCRNYSMLAHGLRAIEFDEAVSISQKVKKLLESLLLEESVRLEDLQRKGWHTVLSYELLQRLF